MSSVDTRVVEMEFDNKQFQKNVQGTLDSLDKLNKGLKLEGATKGLNDVAAASSRFSLAGIASGVESIAGRFQTMGVIAISTLANIATRAVTAGIQLAKSFSVDPILQGLSVYETKLNSIQTILANTSGSKTTLKNVTDALQQLNTYSNQTIYNFGEMARNIGTFTAAGVDLNTSVQAIKGIANLAAISGSSSEQASTAMYQLSQALAAGTVKLMDWNSVVNAGLGGKVFQDALIQTARVHGVAIDQMIKDEGSFRNTLQKGWLTSQVLTETLNKFTGDLNAKQLKAQGYTDAQIKQILLLGKTATEAATKVKTLPQLLDVLKESVATGWAQTFEIVLGNIDEAKELFTNINNVIGGFITASSNARNKVLGDWKALGGRTALIQGIVNVFHALTSVVKPIQDAFRSIFPPVTGQKLFNLTLAFENLTEKLKIGANTINEIKRTFAGVFAVLDIGWQIVKQGLRFFADLFGMVSTGPGFFLKFTAKIGDFLVALDTAIKTGDGLRTFFHNLENDIAPLIKLLNLLRGYLSRLFDGFDPNVVANAVINFTSKLTPLTDFSKIITTVWSKTLSILNDVWDRFFPLAKKFGEFFANFGHAVASAFAGVNYQNILATVNTGLLAGLLVIFKQLVDKFRKGKESTGLFEGIRESIEALTNTFKTMQNTLRAATLLEIAAAIGILTISVVALSKIDSEGLTRALTAMSVMFTQLGVSLFALEKSMNSAKLVKLYIVIGALSGLAIAIDLLTIAVTKLSKLDWNALAKGLTGVTGLLGALVVTMRLMPPAEGMISSGLGIIALSVAINILVTAVTNLSGLSWEEMAKGLTGVAGLLVSLALFTKFAKANATGVLSGAGIILLAAGIKILASAMKDLAGMSWSGIGKSLTAMLGALTIISIALDIIPPTAPLAAAGILITALALGKVAASLQQFGSMGWGSIGKGLVAMLGAMTIIAAALDVISPTAPLSAAGILITAIALGKVANVLDQFAQMSWSEIGKAMVVLAGSLILIAGALLVMTGSLSGAAALLVVSAALTVLSKVLLVFGNMSWGEIIKGLVTLAGVFVVLGLAGVVLTPLVPTLLGLGVAITLLGVGMLAAGAGVFLFAAGLTALSVAGAAGAAAIVAIVSSLVGLIPFVAKQIGLGIIEFAKVIGTAGPAITNALTTVLLAVINALIKLTPKIIQLLGVLLDAMISLAIKYIPKFTDAGLRILIGMMQGVANNIGKVVDTATLIIINFINAIGRNLPKVIDAGVKMIISFVNGLADAINNNVDAMRNAGLRLGEAIVNGMTGGLLGGKGSIGSAARAMASTALNTIKSTFGIGSPSKETHEIGKFTVQGLQNGLNKFSYLAEGAAEDVADKTLNSLGKSMAKVSDILPDTVDLNPVITPVLDLTGVQKDAGRLGTMLSPGVISLDASIASARNAGIGFQTSQDARNTGPGGVVKAGDTIYNQNNYSPKALSSAEIYRQTKNQLSATKGALP